MTLTLLCSGQGQLHAGMFRITGTAPEAASLFDHAASLLGADPRAVAADPAARTANRAGQILCTLQGAAAFAALGRGPARVVMAGYSVGEVAAWCLAGLIAPSVLLDLAAHRAELMDTASLPGDGLLFVRGLARAVIDRLCTEHDAAIAIFNPGNAYVIGGGGEELSAAARAAEMLGASRVERLAVNVASHTPRLFAAAASFLSVLGNLPARRVPAGTRLLAGIDATQVPGVDGGRAKLAAQMAAPVQWAACLEACVEAGATAFLELGPGHALADMAGSAYPGVPARSFDQFRSIEGVRDWIASDASGLRS
jgi:[acyl-carrier-protein] S-malonyltransferase